MGRRLAAIATLVLGFGLLVALVFLFVTHWYAVILAVVAAAVVATGVTRFLATASPRRHGWMATALIGVGGLVVAVVLVAYDRPIALGAFIVVGSVTGTLGLYAQRGYVRVAAAPEVSGPRRVLTCLPWRWPTTCPSCASLRAPATTSPSTSTWAALIRA